MLANGLPAPVVDVIVSIDRAIALGTLAFTSSAVQDLTGRVPTSVRAFLEAHVGLFTTPRA